jgi:tRNA threonylcarbamoyladenosine biosynthesis protein TsaE
VARLDGVAVGALLLQSEGETLHLRRVGVVPEAQHRGVASALASAAEELASRRGFARVDLLARTELPGTVAFWDRSGYSVVAAEDPFLTLAKELPVTLEVPTPEAMHHLGEQLARELRPGDVVILDGDLGAGKTTLVQGIGSGLGVRGAVTSPTFVIARVHPPLDGGPSLVHVDAYRLSPSADAVVTELDDLDLDVTVPESVTVVEWGAQLARALSEDRLEIRITRSAGEAESGEERSVLVVPIGARWVGSGLPGLVPRPVTNL